MGSARFGTAGAEIRSQLDQLPKKTILWFVDIRLQSRLRTPMGKPLEKLLA